MYKFIMILCLFLLQGCYQKIDNIEIKKAIQYCEDRGGIYYIQESFTSGTYITCNNNEKVYDVDIKLIGNN
ncbi:MAG: hypothetical protein GQ540_03230 [Lutibacter sp.]|uniref:hypothetical protein n=1 Tax=Lutibacter sp. TaxID=1925666 RepID=UPI0019FB7FA4|nr:hypothetical protein [Lutibacter sp.]NOR27524.1 hypothetical protein [Lutibacter sp.]